ncbi:MAG: cation:proton antiporter [Candidatus Thermoplasmatota archaeon]|nr:cation:proton antiporter [Candidatus Thermoplasmatota archaeon]
MDLQDVISNPLITFSIILIISLMIPEFLKRYKITAVPFYIIAGVSLGPYGLGLPLGEGLVFLGELGLLFLVFIAGLEIFEMGKIGLRPIVLFTAISAGVCFLAGFLLGLGWGYSILTSTLIGTILISSSIGEIIPMVNSAPTVKKRLANLIFPGIIILDAASLVLLSVIIKTDQPPYMLLIFILELALLIVLSFFGLPRILRFFFNRTSRKPREGDLKFIITILMVIVALGYAIGVHGIVTAFLAGVIVGKYIPSQGVFDKIHAIGYGMLIPVFFIVLGMELDIGVIFEGSGNILFPIILIATLVVSKITGGILFALVKRLPVRDGIILGMVLWPQLSATIAATAVGYETGLFNQEVLVSVVIMALFSVLSTPFILKWFVRRENKRIDTKDHVIIVGHGRTTSKVVYLLERMDFPIVVIDKRYSRLKGLEDRGVPTVFGNAASSHVLKEAIVGEARMAILSIADEHDMYITARRIRKYNRKCHIVAKVHTERALRMLEEEKLIDDYIWPEKRSASEISKKVMPLFTR